MSSIYIPNRVYNQAARAEPDRCRPTADFPSSLPDL